MPNNQIARKISFVSGINTTFALKIIKGVMCTITLSYDQNNALARRKLAALLSTGLFVKKEEAQQSHTKAEEQAHREKIEAFLYTSKKNMSGIIARYL